MLSQADYLIRFKVDQTIGSLAMDGIQISKEMQEIMLLITSGQQSAEQVRAALIEMYRQ